MAEGLKNPLVRQLKQVTINYLNLSQELRTKKSLRLMLLNFMLKRTDSGKTRKGGWSGCRLDEDVAEKLADAIVLQVNRLKDAGKVARYFDGIDSAQITK